MKLTYLLVLVSFLQVSATGFAQKITLHEKNAPLEKVLKNIRTQSGLDLVYTVPSVSNAKPVTVNINNAGLKEALDACFTNQPYTYLLDTKTIIVKLKKAPQNNNPQEVPRKPVTVTGKVTDTTGTPLVGATIKIKGNPNGTLVRNDGTFTISAQTGDEISISFIGYQAYIFTVSENMSFLQIVLHQGFNKLHEVVVSTGYQTLPKDRATGSFAQPNKAMYDARVSTGILSRLEGITSGLIFNSGVLGADPNSPDLNIRGRSTIYSNDQPLIVVDNFPYNGNINDLNPQDVESINILKDAAAAAIWGVKAGNGVIVITTKKGKLNQATKVSFSSNVTVGAKPNLKYDPNFLSSPNYIDIQQFLFRNGKYDADLADVINYPAIPAAVEIMSAKRNGTISAQDSINRIGALQNIDIRDGLLKYYYTNPVNQQYALNISSGGPKSSYYFSAGYDKIQSDQKSINNDRITLNFSNTYIPVKNLEITTQINYVLGNSYSTSPLSLSSATGVSNLYFPYTAFADQNGNPLAVNSGYSNSYKSQAVQNNFLNWDYVPLSEFGADRNKTKTTDARIFSGLKYTFLQGLSAEVKYQYQKYNTEYSELQGQQLYATRNLINQYSILTNNKVTGYNIPVGDLLGLQNGYTESNNFRGQLGYNHPGKHAVNAIAGAEIIDYRNGVNSNLLYGYSEATDSYKAVDNVNYFTLNPSGYSSIPFGSGITHTIDRYRSFFISSAYTYDDRFTLSASARQDGSNYFGVATNQKSVPLWSVGGKWAIDHEPFYKITWLPVLQLRATYGYNGNLNKAVTGVTTFKYFTNATWTGLPYASVSNIGNPELRWEKNGILNLGVDFAVINNRLSGSIEYYIKNGVDLIGNQLLAPSVGYLSGNTGTNVLTGNFAGMRGHGLDIVLNSNNIQGDFGWSTALNFSYTTDEVTKYDQGTTTSFGAFPSSGFSILPNIGKPVYALYSYKWAGLDPATGDPQGYVNGVVSKVYSALINPSSVNDLVYNGPSRPPFFGGIANRFNYKRISMLFNISYKLGYYFRRSTISYSTLFSSGGGNGDYALRWQKPGDELRTTVPSMIYPASGSRDQFYSLSEATVEKGDHIRLQDINISYDLMNFTKATGFPVRKLRVFTYANNLGILWRANKKGLDPDFPMGGIPTPRTISVGLKADL